MNSPFKIFPSTGYKNSQFQATAQLSNLLIRFILDGEVELEIIANPEHPTLITKLSKPGKYQAVCIVNGVKHSQSIEIKDAIRLGSGEFKAAYTFDSIDYSFLLMKDKMLLFDEKTNTILTENDISPTDIRKIDDQHVLFITKIGNNESGIWNFGIFDTDKLSIKSELLSKYQVVVHNSLANKIWLYDVVSETIVCFEIIEGAFKLCYQSLITSNYKHTDDRLLFIESDNTIAVIHTESLRLAEITKSPSTAIDFDGYVYSLVDNGIHISGCFETLNQVIGVNIENVNLRTDRLFFTGSGFKNSDTLPIEPELTEGIVSDILAAADPSKTNQYIALPEHDVPLTTSPAHELYPTTDGVFLVSKITYRTIQGINLSKDAQGGWLYTPKMLIWNKYIITFHSASDSKQIIPETGLLQVLAYKHLTLVVRTESSEFVLRGIQKKTYPLYNDIRFISYPAMGHAYMITKFKSSYSLYNLDDFSTPILKAISIHNLYLLAYHSTLWYSPGEMDKVSDTRLLHGFNLATGRKVAVNIDEAKHSQYKADSDFIFGKDYILSSNKVLIHPANGNIRDAAFDSILAYSDSLNKVITRRGEHIYLMQYNAESSKYENHEINLIGTFYRESFLSPNGRYLVLKEKSNDYELYNLENEKSERFFSGNFLAFSNEGNLIIEPDHRRNAKVIDPLTFEDITPPNYHYYRYLSPDGKLYAQLSLLVKYYDNVSGKYITDKEYADLVSKLDMPSSYFTSEKTAILEKLKKNRDAYYAVNTTRLNSLGVHNAEDVSTSRFMEVTKYIEIGITGTDVVLPIEIPTDVEFYNWGAFSYDNTFFSYVGKPPHKGVIHLFKIDFNNSSNTLRLVDSFESRLPHKAAWVCGFSKHGYFATYDSNPVTYVFKKPEDLLLKKPSAGELTPLTNNSEIHQSDSYLLTKLGKNFLCFSPEGKYVALSEQGYHPLTLGGSGHQESNAVHIAEAETLNIIDSFIGHGDAIREDFHKKVVFVAFSEDEKKIMSMSRDGVVIVRNISL
ncbi:hypothetical protein K3G39_20100 [Pontibacter sp. HSC-14F20]|uniref:hypothetical protein n=1 Tax=Pontibacter sp. HSC-14F20 TaxID=2864136 RepID=UPI001C734D18|nr:hypothetical protein [Pontibacter sp. HSC-14F20]MBX0335540.1 hypothetical protein [Pontibacter sp. HSC-14F20]